MITIVYDNQETPDQLQSSWGFSCVVNGFDQRVLFDTGSEGDILLHNMEVLELDPDAIDSIVLSHNHWDHIGGLDAFLDVNPNVTAYIPKVFPESLKKSVQDCGAGIVETSDACTLCPGVSTTPVLGGDIKEQGLCVEHPEGWVLLTGCAHPGIAEMVEAANETIGPDIKTALGGFHMKDDWNTDINRTTAELQDLGVQKVGPCHCSGDAAREKMASVYGDDFLDVTTGSTIG